MPGKPLRSPVLRTAVLLAAIGALLFALLPATTNAATTAALDPATYGFQGEGPGRIADVDRRVGLVAPTSAQRTLADELGAQVRWNAFGTVHMISRWTGYLSAPAAGAAVDVARAWVGSHRELFRLAEGDVAALEVVRDSVLHDAPDLRRIARGAAPRNTDVAHVVLFRQRLAGLDHGLDGLLSVSVDRAGRVVSAWSSVTGRTEVTNARRLTWQQAYVAAAADVGRTVDAGALEVLDELTDQGFTTFSVPGSADAQYVRAATVPTPADGVRLAWETVVLDATDGGGHPEAYISFVDAQTGQVLHRTNRVDHLAAGDGLVAQTEPEGDGTPLWLHFPAFPEPVGPLDEAVPDTREQWCWVPGPDCDLVVGVDERAGSAFTNAASPLAWDVDPRSQQPTLTTQGNNARTAVSEQSPLTPDTALRRPVAPDRRYAFEWQNVWFTSQCDPSNFDRPDRNRNDEDAATTNLFVGHNRIHDWAYHLGWTEENSNLQTSNFGKTAPGPYPTGREEDPEYGQSQSGRMNPAFLGRDNANQITLQDGTPGITNQYLWQPLQAGFYAPCVDGAYDMSIVGHEVGHAIQNRMTGGPDQGLSGAQARSMGESWSDLTAMEYLNAYGYVPVGDESPYAVGPYATGDTWAAIRNYNMTVSPLNFSDIEYDGNGTTSPHADGEIWTALNFDLRRAFIARHDDEFPASDGALQRRCADGLLPANRCPGNRRWIQIMHDAFLTQPPVTTMVDARDAQLAADRLRFGGAHLRDMWDVYAARGLGQEAATTPGLVCTNAVLISPCPPTDQVESGADDRQPTPGWTSPLRDDHATVTFAAAGVGGEPAAERMEVYVGVYEARATPAADTDPATNGEPDPATPDGPPRPNIRARVPFNPGTYEFIARAPGYGAFRFTQTFRPNETTTVKVPLRVNHASFFHGGEAAGDGGNLEQLIDDTERTNWASFQDGPVQGKQVTVKLGTGRQTVREVQVSAALRPQGETEDPAEEREPSDDPSEQPEDDPPYDTGGQNRFSALRQFEILTCDATTGKECVEEADFRSIYVSPTDAFPSIRPRPRAPELTLRPFDVPDTPATHVRIKVLQNQCTGNPLYNGENNPDADPSNDPDCVAGFSTVGAANTNQTRRDNSQAEVVRIAELQVFGDRPPVLGDPCGGVQVAASYVDRPDAREAHQRSVDCVVFRRIAIGQQRPDGRRYLPRDDVTRGQMASFIVNDLVSAGHGGKLPSGRAPDRFTDIADDTHRANINRLARAGIVSGTGGGRYSPRAKVSREQMATFMVAATQFAIGPVVGNDGRSRFGDVAGSNVHHGNIEFGADLGLFSGTTATRFAPKARVQRDQMASFLVNLLRRTAPQFEG